MKVSCCADVETLSCEAGGVAVAIAMVLINEETGEFLPEHVYEAVEEGFSTTDADTLRFWENKGTNPNPHGPALLAAYREMVKPASFVAAKIVKFMRDAVAKYGHIRFIGDAPNFDISMIDGLTEKFANEKDRLRVIFGAFRPNGERGWGSCWDIDSHMQGFKEMAEAMCYEGQFICEGKVTTVKGIETDGVAEFEKKWPELLTKPVIDVKHDCMYDAAKMAFVFIYARNKVYKKRLVPVAFPV